MKYNVVFSVEPEIFGNAIASLKENVDKMLKEGW